MFECWLKEKQLSTKDHKKMEYGLWGQVQDTHIFTHTLIYSAGFGVGQWILTSLNPSLLKGLYWMYEFPGRLFGVTYVYYKIICE